MSRKEIIESVKHSLRNLGMDYIDLVIIHKCDPNCPIEGKKKIHNIFLRYIFTIERSFSEVVRAMTFLIEAGLVMYWGTSRWTPFEIFECYSTVSLKLTQSTKIDRNRPNRQKTTKLTRKLENRWIPTDLLKNKDN